jgi:hypothetical protein
MPRFVVRAAAFLTAVCFACVLPALAEAAPITASDIPDARYTNTASGGITNVADSGKFQGTILPTTGVSVSGSGDGIRGPTLFNASTSNNYSIPSISAFALANDGATASAQSALVYFVAFSGADGIIPVNMQASGGVDSTGGRAFLQLSLDLVETSAYVFTPATLDITGGSQLLSLNQTFMLTANALYRVIMNTQGFSLGTGGAASAHLDPFFSAPGGYSVLTSAGIGNAAPVAATPIPAALPLFAGALGVLGLLGRRKKAAAHAT